MVPVQFGRSDHVMLGVFNPALGRRLRRGAVICNPWGVEASRAHRSIRALADLLARHGMDVLRFDYFGTGDSAGDGLSGSLEDWVDDARWAVEELLSTAGVSRVALIGLRLGAYVAAVTASRATDTVDRLVLWDPVVDGADYLTQLQASRRSPDAGHGLEDVNSGVEEVSGYPLPAAFQNALRGARLAELPGRDLPTLVALSAGDAQASLRELGARSLEVVVHESPGCWLEERDFGAGAIPVELLKAIGAWLTQP